MAWCHLGVATAELVQANSGSDQPYIDIIDSHSSTPFNLTRVSFKNSSPIRTRPSTTSPLGRHASSVLLSGARKSFLSASVVRSDLMPV